MQQVVDDATSTVEFEEISEFEINRATSLTGTFVDGKEIITGVGNQDVTMSFTV